MGRAILLVERRCIESPWTGVGPCSLLTYPATSGLCVDPDSVQGPIVATDVVPGSLGRSVWGQHSFLFDVPCPFLPRKTLELQGHPSPGNGAGVQSLFGDFLDISDMKPLKFSQVPMAG